MCACLNMNCFSNRIIWSLSQLLISLITNVWISFDFFVVFPLMPLYYKQSDTESCTVATVYRLAEPSRTSDYSHHFFSNWNGTVTVNCDLIDHLRPIGRHYNPLFKKDTWKLVWHHSFGNRSARKHEFRCSVGNANFRYLFITKIEFGLQFSILHAWIK